MTYKITSDALYTIAVENSNGDDVQISIDSTDIAQVDSLLSLMDSFSDMRVRLQKRAKKAEKDYKDEKVYMRQLVRITREEIETFNPLIDSVFGEGKSKDIFLGSLSIGLYAKFFDLLLKEFEPAIQKGENAVKSLFDKYDLDKAADDVL